MSIAVTRTKIRVPRRRKDLLSRSRLNSELIDLLDFPFTLISAPAGYGKTSLMIDLAHQASYPACWYTIDPLDKDPKRFFIHFVYAIKELFPEFGGPSIDVLDNIPDPISYPDQLISTIVNDIYTSISEHFVIFLDDYHLLGNQELIEDFISKFGRQMDDNTHLVISSRKRFNFPDMPLLIARKLVKGVDQEDLAFQPGELREYFHEKLHLDLSEEESIHMVSASSGWITGLLLGTESTGNHIPGQTKAVRVTGADLDSYFSDQVFKRQPTAIQDMMLRTSLFDEFNQDFCIQILGAPDQTTWSDFETAITDHNLFVEQVDDDGVWFRYHDLFRSFLSSELTQQIPEERDRILNLLVAFHEKRQDWEKAYDAANRLANPRIMAGVIDKALSSLFHGGRIKLLSDWLEDLPEEGFKTYPLLYSLKGFLLTELGNPQVGLKEIKSSINENVIKTNSIYHAKSLVWLSTANRFLGRYKQGINNSQKALNVINSETDSYQNIFEIEAEAFRELGLLNGRLGKYDKALSFLRKSYEKYKIEERTNNLIQVQFDIGHVLLNMGKFKDAENCFVKTISYWTQKRNHNQLSNVINNLGYLSILTGRYCDANNWITQGYEYAKTSFNTRMLSFITASRGDLALSLHKFKNALSSYYEAEKISDQVLDSLLVIYLPIVKASCLRNLGKLTEAKKTLQSVEEAHFHDKSRNELGLWHLEWGFTHLALNNPDTARKSFHLAREIFSNSRKPYEEAKSLLGICLLTTAQGDNRSLKFQLLELESLLKNVETLQPLVPEFSHYQESIFEMVSIQPGLNQLEACLQAIQAYQEDLPAIQQAIYPAVAHKPEPLKLEIKGLGDMQVNKDAKKLSVSEWIHQKTVRELFYYLLAHRKGVSRDQIGLDFWPDSSPSQLSCQFKNAIYRLRRAIGNDYIQYQQGTRRYLFNRELRYRYDVDEFLEACRLGDEERDAEKRVSYLRKAAAIYAHPFAPQLDGVWVEPLRRKYYLLYEKAQLEIAEFELRKENFEACLDSCLAVLNIDPCQEKAYQLCMKGYHGQSKYTEIHRIFKKCKYHFLNDLGIRPSNITLKLYDNLVSN